MMRTRALRQAAAFWQIQMVTSDLASSLEQTMNFDADEVQRALREAWSLSTASQWTQDNPAAGQCNVTALLVHDLFGGDLLKTPLPAGDHFYNRIGGCRYDFTASQFDQPITYMDLPTSRADAEFGATNDELAKLRAAFQRHRAKSGSKAGIGTAG